MPVESPPQGLPLVSFGSAPAQLAADEGKKGRPLVGRVMSLIADPFVMGLPLSFASAAAQPGQWRRRGAWDQAEFSPGLGHWAIARVCPAVEVSAHSTVQAPSRVLGCRKHLSDGPKDDDSDSAISCEQVSRQQNGDPLNTPRKVRWGEIVAPSVLGCSFNSAGLGRGLLLANRQPWTVNYRTCGASHGKITSMVHEEIRLEEKLLSGLQHQPRLPHQSLLNTSHSSQVLITQSVFCTQARDRARYPSPVDVEASSRFTLSPWEVRARILALWAVI
jgi:hypothetical protein